MKVHLQTISIFCLGGLLWMSTTSLLAQEVVSRQNLVHSPKFQETSTVNSLQSVLQKLEKQYNVRFNYRTDVVQDVFVKVSLSDLGNKGLEEMLKSLLQPKNLEFEKLKENRYLIYSKTPKEEIPQLKKKEIKNSRESSTIFGNLKEITERGMSVMENNRDMEVRGKVTAMEDKSPIPGVNVIVKGTTIGTTTDINGAYVINVPDAGSVLVFSFVGYNSEEIQVGNRRMLDVALAPNISELQEVVVVGYGSVERRDLTGSVSQVKPEEINAFPVRSLDQALKGRAAGVRVTQNSGRPGARVQIQIRGGNSIIGNNSPLFVVDGFPITGGIDFLNPSDIESMDILKDASATAIYGARGANGVIIVTTKKGSRESGNMTLESYYGVQSVRKRYDLMNARQFAEIANEAALNDGGVAPFDLNNLGGVDTDWQDQVFTAAPIQSHTLTFNGGGAKSSYSISGSYFDQDGIVINTGTTRGNLRLSMDQEVKSWVKVTTSLALTRSQTKSLPTDNGHRGNGVLSGAFVSPPLLSPRTETGEYTDVAPYSFSPNVLQNPLAFSEVTTQSFNNTILGNLSAEFKLAEGLTFTVMGGTEQFFNEGNNYSPSILNGTPTGSASTSLSRNISYLNENILNYNRKIGSNDKLTLTGGFTWQQYQSKFNSSGGSGFVNDILLNNNLASAEVTQPNNSSVTEWTLLSWLGRVNYSLNDRFLFTASVRADGSSRFGENNKWGIFPSGAFAWRLSDEPFIQNLQTFSDLKFRVSYGVTGSTAVSPYQSLLRLSGVRATFGNSDVIGFAPNALPNSDLKWETTGQFNIGVDAGFLDERLRLTFDYYKKNTYDLLARIPLPVSVGFSSIIRNLGEISNTGIEIGVGYDILVKDFKWNIFAQVSSNKNEVIDVGGEDIFGPGVSIPFAAPLNLVREGQPLGVFYGFLEDGLDENGRIKFKDLNEDGQITNSDQTIIGVPYPKMIYSLNSHFAYKNFDLNLFFEGVSGNDVLFATGGSLSNSFNFGENQLVDVYNNRWRPENPNPNAKYPRISRTTTFRVSDRFVKDGSYVRLQNIRLAYNVPVSNVSWINSAQIYVSGQNLITITNYPGLDPEVNSHGSEGDLRIGIDETAYPTSKIYTFGVRLGF